MVGLAPGWAVKVRRPALTTGCLSGVQVVGTHEAKVIQEVKPLEMRFPEARVAVEIAEDNGGCRSIRGAYADRPRPVNRQADGTPGFAYTTRTLKDNPAANSAGKKHRFEPWEQRGRPQTPKSHLSVWLAATAANAAERSLQPPEGRIRKAGGEDPRQLVDGRATGVVPGADTHVFLARRSPTAAS
jgi:hypothetical protein